PPYHLSLHDALPICAIPGWFAPVVIAGERHVDGGAHSASNLDVLAGAGLDLVVAVSPMSVERGALTASADAVLRRGVGLRLAEEDRKSTRLNSSHGS